MNDTDISMFQVLNFILLCILLLIAVDIDDHVRHCPTQCVITI